ncbi:hypothetical protein M0813_08791 [Anaeramoeba flamelloides]|uniref:Phosphatidic acid phosphatase type 2/haloperoxidase domain-containing protein n=1 Tax=Anaeramoeba flamelloides TaxID=1746091 RepID=A0AAV7YWV2_9EUKA|nr:hypothetical protein M0812_22133 [Anaeramoeba flamelloides]KAJ6228441.1 hypothetical protein M0813_08791 [Anaeramoeba flamelloides]
MTEKTSINSSLNENKKINSGSKKKKKKIQLKQVESQLSVRLVTKSNSNSETDSDPDSNKNFDRNPSSDSYSEDIEELLDDKAANGSISTITYGGKTLNSVNPQLISKIKKPKNYYYEMSPRFEFWWYRFDKYWIRVCQKYDNNFAYYFSLALTFLTTIEIALVLPVVCYFIGYDTLANELTWIAFFFQLVSQLPKRFIWRYRPYMRRRAKQKRNDYTSSFPSRAVTGAVVYPLVYHFIIDHMQGSPKLRFHWYLLVLSFVFVISTSFSRINFGVHYPSDCFFGVIQGLIICLVSFPLYGKNLCGCTTCLNSECYSTHTSKSNYVDFGHLSRADWGIFVVLTVIFAIIIALSMIPKISFSRKANLTFGILFACVTFNAVFLCPNQGIKKNTSLTYPKHRNSWFGWLTSIFYIPISIVFGLLFRGKYLSYLSYIIIYIITFCLLMVIRIKEE